MPEDGEFGQGQARVPSSALRNLSFPLIVPLVSSALFRQHEASPDPGCWDRFVSSESAAGPGVPWRLGIGRPGPAGRLSPQQGGKFSVTLPNSSEGQLRETPRAGGLGEREDVDHQLSPPGEGQCAGRGSRPRCIFFFYWVGT